MLFIRPRGAGEGDHTKCGGGGVEIKIRFVVDAPSTILRSTSSLRTVPPPRFAGQKRIIVLAARFPPFVTTGLEPVVHAGGQQTKNLRRIFASVAPAWIAGSSPAMTTQKSVLAMRCIRVLPSHQDQATNHFSGSGRNRFVSETTLFDSPR